MCSGKIGPGFGIGALEDLDAEDEDIYDTGSDFFTIFWYILTDLCCFSAQLDYSVFEGWADLG